MRDIHLPLDQAFPREWRMRQPDDPGPFFVTPPEPRERRFLFRMMAALLICAILALGLMVLIGVRP